MEKPLKDLYFELLEYLSKQGIGIMANIKPICADYVESKYLNMDLSKALEIYNKRWSLVMGVLDSMVRDGYIKYSINYELEQLYHTNGVFNVSITKEGFEYYSTYILREGTIKSLNNQKILGIISIIIAVISIAIAFYTTIQNTDLSQRLQQLETKANQSQTTQPIRATTHKIGDTIQKKK